MSIASMAAFATLNKILRIVKNQSLYMPHVNGRFIHKLYPAICSRIPITTNTSLTIRHSSFRSSRELNSENIENEYPKIEIFKDSVEWKYVEKLLAPKIVPRPALKEEYPSEWTPQKLNRKSNKQPYFIERTKNHMIPVYIDRTFRGMRILTKLRRVEGDIWALESELKNIIETSTGKKIITRVNEMNGQIEFKGDHLNLIHDYLMSKGF